MTANNNVSIKDVANGMKTSALEISDAGVKAVKLAAGTIDILSDGISPLANAAKRLRVDSDAMQTLHDLKPALVETKAFRKVGKLMLAIGLMERVLDGDTLSDAEYDQLDAIQTELT